MKKLVALLKNQTIRIVMLVITLILITSSLTYVLIKSNSKGNKCTVAFETNGGSHVDSLNINCGSVINEPVVPSKDGFKFDGWYIESEPFDFNKSINENIIIIAKWIAIDNSEIVLVRFDTLGGTHISDFEVSKGVTISAPVAPKKDGYEFEYWELNNKKFSFNTPIEQEITLVARWKKIESKPKDSIPSSTSSNDKTNIIKKDNYTCWGGFSKEAEDKNLNIFDNWNFNYLWNVNFNYAGSDVCGFSYKSSNSNVVAISDAGNLTIKGAGIANISKCIYDLKTKEEITCLTGKVTVDEKPVKEIICAHPQNGASNYLDNNKRYVDFYIKPYDYINSNFTISVDDPSVFAIEKLETSGRTYTTFSGENVGSISYSFRALKIGTTKIKLTASNGVVGYCEYTIERRIADLLGVTINKKQLTLYKGDSATLSYTLNPSEAISSDYWNQWETSNNKIVTVDSKGKIVAKDLGEADITINFGGSLKDTCHVTVIQRPLSANGQIAYTIVATDQGTYSGVKATVNATGGAGNNKYSITLYKEGKQVSQRLNSPINNTIVFGYGNGTYTAEYTVVDGDGTTITGVLGPTTISVQ